jgi:transient receptor potential cation channel subfamily A protein 1
MVVHGRVELLAHPLSQKYLQMKWNSYGKYFHLANLLFYCIFLMLVTMFASHMMQNMVSVSDNSETPQHRNSNYSFSLSDMYDNSQMKLTSTIVTSGIFIIVYVLLNSIREFIQLYQQKWHYLFEPINLISCLLYVSAFIMVIPIFIDGNMSSCHVSATSVTVFLSWFNLLLFLQRFDQVGIYVVMFLEILQTLIKVLIVFSILIIAFGLAFYILLSKINDPTPNHVSFQTISMSLFRTFSMMLGEIDFVGTYIYPFHRLPYPTASFVILCKYKSSVPQ